MNPDDAVRLAAPDDVPAIQRVARVAWHAAHADIVGEEGVEWMLDEHYDAASLKVSVGDDGSVFFVADAYGVVGFANAGPAREEGWSLYRIYVHPDRWGEGFGTALLDRVEAAVHERGVGTLRLVVMADNEGGVHFYESRGFERVDEHWDEHLDVAGYVYAKEL